MDEIIRIGDAMELRFLQTDEGTDASLTMFEMTLQPEGRMPVPHHHESWDETVYGLAGTISWRIDGQDVDLVPGGSLFIKRGAVHGFVNRSGQSATCLCVLTPGRLGPAYFRDMAALVQNGAPDPAKMKQTMLRHGLIPAPPA